ERGTRTRTLVGSAGLPAVGAAFSSLALSTTRPPLAGSSAPTASAGRSEIVTTSCTGSEDAAAASTFLGSTVATARATGAFAADLRATEQVAVVAEVSRQGSRCPRRAYRVALSRLTKE